MSHTFAEKCMSEDAKRDVANLYRYVKPGFDVRTFVLALRNIADFWDVYNTYNEWAEEEDAIAADEIERLREELERMDIQRRPAVMHDRSLEDE